MPALAPAKLPSVEFTTLHPPLASARVNNPHHLAPYGYNTGLDWAHHARLESHNHATHPHQDPGGPYLRWLQPLESDLARQVEYDMDDQDQLWLDALNRDRKRDGLSLISYEVFEVIMDKIEKEWFDLTRNIPKRTNALPSEDSKCAICDDGECENANAIVFCDGCNLAVHQDCYGVPYIPEGQWLCRKCTVSPHKPVWCVLCPGTYGAFKQTTTGQWAHLLCAIWIPDTSVSNTVYMEPVDGIEHIPKSRWKLVCYLCKKRVGACIQCANRSCYTAFHVTCAREHGLSLKMRQGSAATGELRAYCDKHGETTQPRTATPFKHGPSSSSSASLVAPLAPAGSLNQNQIALASAAASTSASISTAPVPVPVPVPAAAATTAEPSLLKLSFKLPVDAGATASGSGSGSGSTAASSAAAPAGGGGGGGGTKSARAYQTTSSRAPPVVPHKLAERIVAYLSAPASRAPGQGGSGGQGGGGIKLANKKEVVNVVCRYWSLKREARRGAPLLKRIHLEPWTASATARQQSEADKAHKLELLRLVRNDLEKVRMLTELVRKRERKKLERATWVRTTVDGWVFPREDEMRKVLDEVKALDKQRYFAQPVDRALVPDYYDLIHYPMDWETMGTKLARHEYLSGADFVGDVRLVINNARRYNTSSAPVHKAAVRVLSAIEPRLAALDADADTDLSSSAALPRAALAELLDNEARDELFEFGYDTRDPEGRKKARREERERRAREDEEGRVRVEEEERARAEEEGERAAEAAAAGEADNVEVKPKPRGRAGAKKGKGKGKARAVDVEPTPAADAAVEEEEDAALEPEQDEPSTSTTAAAVAPATKGRKRTAALAGLDSPAPSARTPRTTRAGTAAATPVPTPAPAPKRARPSRGRAVAQDEPVVEQDEGEAEDVVMQPLAAIASDKKQGKGRGRAVKPLPKGYAGVEVVERAPAMSAAARKEVALLEDVDPKASFKHFETGWVLPEGSRRRSSASASMSASGTPRTGALALPPTPSTTDAAALAPPPAPPSTAATRKGKGRAVEPVVEEDEEEEGPSVVENAEVEDVKPSPAKRARQDKKARSTAPVETPKKQGKGATPGPTPSQTPQPGMSAVHIGQADAEAARQFDKRMLELLPQIEITAKTDLSEGYLVWARQPPFPFFPAEVVDPDADDTPSFIRENRPAGTDKVPVLFFDDPPRSGGWIARTNLRELAESAEADQLLLSRAALVSNRRARRVTGRQAQSYSKMLEDLQAAFEWATENAENTDDEQERLAEEKAAGATGAARKKGKAKPKGKRRGSAGQEEALRRSGLERAW